ncbi:MAG: acyl-CoA dehydrogenase family protein [Pseudomonadota bacterium]|nr:acyl-CoA dehydrogenase family protein [Pseudomonadota bacterium]
MNIDFSPEELQFREEVKAWFEANVPADLKRKAELGESLTREETISWGRKLNEKGWVAPSWPAEYGGTDWTSTQKHIFEEVRAEVGAPQVFSMGITMLGPVLMQFGTDEQKAQYLPRILNFDDWWCQGYSEPGAGSDLAGLKTAAVLEGDEYVVNGSKIWTTGAHHANKMFCLVRTDANVKKQRGISFLLLDMSDPGMEVRPIISIDGEHHLNQVFLDNVRTHKSNLVGKENEGWTVAKFLLTHERTSIAGVGASKAALNKIKRIAREQTRNGRSLIEDEQVARRIAEAEVDFLALEYTNFRTLAATASGQAPGAESSLLKIRGTETQQALQELKVLLAGYYAYPWGTEDAVGPAEFKQATANYNFGRASTIYGGSTEVQYTVMAKALLGL